MPLELAEEVFDDCHTLTVAGDLDAAAAPELEDRISRLCADGAREIVLDLHELSFLDSSGLRLILACRDRCDLGGCEFSLTRVQPPAQRLFELTGAIDWLSWHGRALAQRITRRGGRSEQIAATRRPPALEVTLALDPDAPRSARNYVRDLLRGEPSRDMREGALLLTSELVTSVVVGDVKPPAECQLRVWLRAELVRVELAVPCVLLSPSPPEDTRYDLMLLHEVADRWAIDVADPIASIWFELGREGRVGGGSG